MNAERDVERVLERWLADGIDEMPDRVYRSVLDRVDRQPQRRAWRVSERSAAVNPYLKPILAVAAAIAVAIGGYAILASPSGSQVGGAASPSPSLPPPLPDGSVTAGEYVMRAVPADPMAFIVTAPAGWTGFGQFFLGGPNTSGPPAGIGISVNHDPDVTAEPCDGAAHSPDPSSTGPSVADLVREISAREDLTVSGVTDTTLAGHAGTRLDVQFPAERPCAGQQYLFAEPKGLYANGPSNRWRIWILDADGETAVVVLLDYPQTAAADRAEAEAVIDTIRILP